MAKYNVTLDSTGPLIDELGGVWQGGNSPLLVGEDSTKYYDGTVAVTDAQGGSSVITFNGTAIYLYGSRGLKYGEFMVTIDSLVAFNSTEGSADTLYQQLIYHNTNLTMGTHTLTLTNTWSNPARNLTAIDYYIWTTQIGSEGSVIASNNTIEWSNSTLWNFNGAWSQTGTSSLYPAFANGASYANTANANATLTFEGDAVTVYGATSNLTGPYQVFLDQASIKTYTAYHTEVNNEVIIFYADNLGPGVHELTFVNNPNELGTDNTLVIGKAIVVQATASAHHSNVGAIAGGTIGGLALIALALALFFWRRHCNRSAPTEHLDIEPNTAETQVEPYVVEAFNPATLVSSGASAPGSSQSPPTSNASAHPRTKGQLILTPAGSSIATPSTPAAPATAHTMSDTADIEEPPPMYS